MARSTTQSLRAILLWRGLHRHPGFDLHPKGRGNEGARAPTPKWLQWRLFATECCGHAVNHSTHRWPPEVEERSHRRAKPPTSEAASPKARVGATGLRSALYRLRRFEGHHSTSTAAHSQGLQRAASLLPLLARPPPIAGPLTPLHLSRERESCCCLLQNELPPQKVCGWRASCASTGERPEEALQAQGQLWGPPQATAQGVAPLQLQLPLPPLQARVSLKTAERKCTRHGAV